MFDVEKPVTRFKVAPAALLNWTEPPEPIEKPVQSMIARLELWLTVRLEPDATMLADPACTTPPVGSTTPAAARVASPLAPTRPTRAMPKIGQRPVRFLRVASPSARTPITNPLKPTLNRAVLNQIDAMGSPCLGARSHLHSTAPSG
jgi:hypothetical protein